MVGVGAGDVRPQVLPVNGAAERPDDGVGAEEAPERRPDQRPTSQIEGVVTDLIAGRSGELVVAAENDRFAVRMTNGFVPWTKR